MLKKARTDTARLDIADSVMAADLRGVTKTFTQWQRENAGRGLIKNLLKPDKRIITALDNVSFGISQGEFVAYAGPNGAGKSTTLKMLAGMLQPNSGTVSVLGMSPRTQRVPLMREVGVLFGNRTELWWDHPVSQSFEWKRVVWDIPDGVYNENVDMLTRLLDIQPMMKTFARELSLGQRMKADIALMLLHSPRLILLDEPTLGLDVVAKRDIINFIKRLNAENGVTVIVTSHDMDDLEEMANRVLMISGGNIVYDGGFDGLRDVAGSHSRISITTSDDNPPHIRDCVLLSQRNGVFEFEVDLSVLSVKDLLYRISQLDNIHDVELKKAPIEQVISSLYVAWKNKTQQPSF